MYFTYARPYLWVALPITLMTWYFAWLRGPGAMTILLFLKVVVMILALLTLRRIRDKEIYFYLNLGYGEKRLLVVTAVVDFMVWALGTTITIMATG